MPSCGVWSDCDQYITAWAVTIRGFSTHRKLSESPKDADVRQLQLQVTVLERHRSNVRTMCIQCLYARSFACNNLRSLGEPTVGMTQFVCHASIFRPRLSHPHVTVAVQKVGHDAR